MLGISFFFKEYNGPCSKIQYYHCTISKTHNKAMVLFCRWNILRVKYYNILQQESKQHQRLRRVQTRVCPQPADKDVSSACVFWVLSCHVCLSVSVIWHRSPGHMLSQARRQNKPSRLCTFPTYSISTQISKYCCSTVLNGHFLLLFS